MSNSTDLLDEDPRQLGPYRLTGRVGAGGQGVVYRGVTDDGRAVAVKALHAEIAADDAARRRIGKEVAAARRVDGAPTARVLDADVDGPRPYVVTEFIEGRSLFDAVSADGSDGPIGMTVRRADLLRLAVDTLTALAAIHDAGVVHRDFKPHNVLLSPDGPRVIDFGVARPLDATATRTDNLVGTPAYMAPELIHGAAAGPSADMFAWAATMVFAATGDPPFGDDAVPAVFHRILNADPDLRELPRSLRRTISDCLNKDPAERPTAQEVLRRLQTGPIPRLRAVPKPVGYAAVALAALVLAGILVIRALPSTAPSRAETTAGPSPYGPQLLSRLAGVWYGAIDYEHAKGARRTMIMMRLVLSKTEDLLKREDHPAYAGTFELIPLRCSGWLELRSHGGSEVDLRMRTLSDPQAQCPTVDEIQLSSQSYASPSGIRVLRWLNGDWRDDGNTSTLRRADDSQQIPRGFAGAWSGTLTGPAGKTKIVIGDGSIGVVGAIEFRDCYSALAVDDGEARSITLRMQIGLCQRSFRTATVTMNGTDRVSVQLTTTPGEGQKKETVSTGTLRRTD